ncbi:MAG: ATP-binding cassette domain-containing protein [Verrucomicrobia bacterium]|nr:ATP-binding cassette domain-containing protein [Verrucomicrobiota bacterium]MDA1066629.1 ATP-binding cassette domain-containing protein [Verrucomicrobiota bacterium]
MVNSKAILSVNRLTIERDTYILDQIDWTVQKGENWVILGPNGSGKTSLLKSIVGYFPPTSGSISVLGKVFGSSNWAELRLRIGLVSTAIQQRIEASEPAVDVVVSGKYAQVNYWGRIYKKDRQRALDFMDLLGCRYLEGKTWMTFSQGEKQKLLIARAMMAKLEVLILDEPCAGLDPVARENFLDSIQQLATERPELPIILVTHHVEEITPAFTNALILKEGRVIAQGLIKKTLTSANLSAAFSSKLTLRTSGNRFGLKFDSSQPD